VKCYQCPAPAMYQVGDQNIPLCLNCYSKVAQIEQQELENHERMLNYLSDEISFSFGLPSMGPRFPSRPKPLHIGDVKLNNISVNNSVVGTINTGSIGNLDQSISVLAQLNQPQLAETFKKLSEAILQSGDLTGNQRNELIEALSVISREAATPPETRQNTVALSLLERAEQITSMANDISELCKQYWPMIVAVFSSVSG
jgi:hypothetical protein